MDKRKVIYYSDELNDEFSVTEITPRKIDGDYIYCYNSFFKKFTHFFWYRIVATPAAFLYTKLVFHHKVIGREKLKPFLKKPYFIYGNHTQDIADAFIPSMLNFPKQDYVIVHPNNVSMPVLGKITPSLGALPLPDDKQAHRNFLKAVETRINENKAIVIYPEAHIWPYYTHIRPFSDKSFHYPVKYSTPVFCFTNTYKKRKGSKQPKIITYIDGPFYCSENSSSKEKKEELRKQVYDCMCSRAENSDIEVIKYIKKENNNG